MSEQSQRQREVEAAQAALALPAWVGIRAWAEADFPAIQRLSSTEGRPTPTARPEQALAAWRNSWPALLAVSRTRRLALCAR